MRDEVTEPAPGHGGGTPATGDAPNGPLEGDALDFYLRLVAGHCVDSIIVTDPVGKTLWVNDVFCSITGYRADEVIGRRPGTLLNGPDTDAATLRQIDEAMAARRPVKAELINYTKSGRPYWVELSSSPVFSPEGRHTHFLTFERDISERRALEERTRTIYEAEEYQQSERRLLSQMSEWLYSAKSQKELLEVVALSLRTLMPEADGAFYIYADQRDMLDHAVSWGDGVQPEHVHPDECWALRRGRAYYYGAQAIQLPCGHAPSTDHPVFCLPVVAQGETIGLLHLAFPVFDISVPGDAAPHETFLQQRWTTALTCAEQISLAIANVRLRHALEDRSIRDEMTGLWNRRYFVETGSRLLRSSQVEGREIGLIAVDVDHFKVFNDRFGHDAGDAVLQEVGAAMLRHFPPPAIPCRIGGEEFAVLLPGSDSATTRAEAETLREDIAALALTHAGRDLPRITISAGLASAPQDGTDVSKLLKAADTALYAAKDAGRNCVISAGAPAELHPKRRASDNAVPDRTARKGTRGQIKASGARS